MAGCLLFWTMFDLDLWLSVLSSCGDLSQHEQVKVINNKIKLVHGVKVLYPLFCSYYFIFSRYRLCIHMLAMCSWYLCYNQMVNTRSNAAGGNANQGNQGGGHPLPNPPPLTPEWSLTRLIQSGKAWVTSRFPFMSPTLFGILKSTQNLRLHASLLESCCFWNLESKPTPSHLS